MRNFLFTLTLGSFVFYIAGCGSSNLAPPADPKDPNKPAEHIFHGSCDTGGDPFGAGDGSAGAPFQICSAAQVSNVSLSEHSAKHFLLYENVDMNSGAILQVGNFSGVFDGNGKSIQNWSGDGPMFVNLSGTVKNLTIGNASVTGAYRAGLLAGTVTSTGIIDNCHGQGSLSTSYMSGGLVGANAGHITNSSADVAISGTDHLGGLVGSNSGTVANSYASGAITGSTSQAEEGVDGGLIAWNASGTVTNCYATGAVSGQNAVGGLIGVDGQGTITASYATGAVTGVASSSTMVGIGGLVGISFGSTITNSYAMGLVHGPKNTGGFIGSNGSNLTNNFSTGAVAGGANTGGFSGTSTITITPAGGGSPVVYNGTVTSSYWDTQSSGQPASAQGTGETTSAMQTTATFSGWNFTTIWNAPSGSYPTLR